MSKLDELKGEVRLVG